MFDNSKQDDLRSGLARLDDLKNFKVADGDLDPRGWDLKTSDNRKVGEVDSLVVDQAALKVRYLDVKLDRKALRLGDDRHVLIPIGSARLDDDRDDVLLDSMTPEELIALPPYRDGAMTREDEVKMRRRFDGGYAPPAGSARDLYDHDHYDENRFFGKRRAGREDAAYITRAEEELAIDKKARAGEVEVRKTVETEHVKQQVPVAREEVTIDRRPLRGDAAEAGDLEIGEDEIRVPVMAEEVVTEKRAVAKEEVVIGKKTVTEQKTVEADLRKERIEVDGDVSRGSSGREGGSARDGR